MDQTTYHNVSDLILIWKNTTVEDTHALKFNKLLNRLEKLMNDEYKYGSSAYEVELIYKTIDEIKQIVSIKKTVEIN